MCWVCGQALWHCLYHIRVQLSVNINCTNTMYKPCGSVCIGDRYNDECIKWWHQQHNSACITYWCIREACTIGSNKRYVYLSVVVHLWLRLLHLTINIFWLISMCGKINRKHEVDGVPCWLSTAGVVNRQKACGQQCIWMTKHRWQAVSWICSSLVVCLVQQ